MRLVLAATLLMMVTAGAGWATELPAYDIDGICARNQQAYGTKSAVCISLNQRAYDDLKFMWRDISEYVRARAIRQCNEAGPRPDYVHLHACIDGWLARESDEAATRSRNENPHFRP